MNIFQDNNNLKMPIQCFVTFEYEYGLEKFLKELKSPKSEISKYFKKIKVANEPSDVIFESLHVSKENKKRETYKASFYITFFMILVFYLMILMFGYTSHISMKYPKVH